MCSNRSRLKKQQQHEKHLNALSVKQTWFEVKAIQVYDVQICAPIYTHVTVTCLVHIIPFCMSWQVLFSPLILIFADMKFSIHNFVIASCRWCIWCLLVVENINAEFESVVQMSCAVVNEIIIHYSYLSSDCS